MYEQLDLFSISRQPIAITKPIRLIELFADYDSQAMALKRIGADFEERCDLLDSVDEMFKRVQTIKS